MTREEAKHLPETAFHGRRGPATFTEGVPAFFTLDRRGAEWYAMERGDPGHEPYVHAAVLSMRHAARYDDLIRAVEEAGATTEDVQAHSPNDGDNANDFLYVPGVQQALERRGFDAYEGWDVLTNDEIPIVVVWHPEQIRLRGAGER